MQCIIHLYKIVAKVLANRIKLVITNVISDSQSAFIEGRLITDNVLVASEVNHFLKRKRQGKVGVAALKVDIRKAYDRMEWDFLMAMMCKLGFSARFIELIMMCVTTVKYSIVCDG